MLYNLIDYHYVIIGKDNCPACELAKQLLSDANVKFVYFDLSSDSTSAIAYIALLDATKTLIGRTVPPTIPQIYLCMTEESITKIEQITELMEKNKVKHIGGYRDLKLLSETPDSNNK